ncbi:glycosyltransferase [Candidatus Saccharibacteria bacterium]|nr:glycosyltransferase [Candidatus Saccharibacteria bacterium]
MKKVLYVVEDEISAQFRYRVKNVMEAMGVSKQWDVEWCLKSGIEKVRFVEYDLVVILRQTAKDNAILDFIQKAQSLGIRVLFDLDDLVFDFRDLPLLMESTNSRNVFYWTGYFWGVRRIAKMVDGFLCTNEFLGKKLKRSFGKGYQVIPNSLNREQVEVSEKCVKNKKWDSFRIGYFSGSPTHAKDFAVAEPELIKFLDKHDDVVLNVVGYMRFSKGAGELLKKGRIRFLPLVDFRKLQRLMTEVDVNIAPLVVNDFTNCKSELKFFEAAVVETTTIASPIYTFKKAIVDGKNGYLAQPGEWYDKLEYLYRHPEKNREVALAAKKYALENYYGKKFLQEVEAAYDSFAK